MCHKMVSKGYNKTLLHKMNYSGLEHFFPLSQRNVIETAVTADSTIREKYDKHKEGMDMLSAGPENLAASLPSAGASNNGSNPAIQRLRQLMEDVETLKVGCLSFDLWWSVLRAVCLLHSFFLQETNQELNSAKILFL